ncbi:HyaD/HybD family hydrogenase maturation endopeptidase [Ferrimonas futtsuensis]|uniref:HyaD/HybD family hydrogenase maturation endopeptidase n=1 Tax=Ferrimonas futtsuensis TaxID=364764 RepID=UPI00040E6810|nr:HyaD/HybD family hydrogenase maturation endopeptidase [Ferrimonas futtsuensis]
MPEKILILGIGNVLYADEGIGVHFANYFQKAYKFEGQPQLEFMDGGTLANALIPLIAPYDHLVVVDTINSANANFGDVFFFNFDRAPAEVDWQGSAHEVEMLQTLNMMDMVGDRPETYVLGVVPTVLESMSFELTDQVKGAVPTMEKALVGHLETLGIRATKVKDLDIQALAHQSCDT